jgi:hypothetical protein
MKSGVKFGGRFHFRCVDKDKKIKWETEADNMVVNEGLNYLLDVGLVGSSNAQIDPFYVGLLTSSPSISATDGTSDLTEFTAYSSERKAYTNTRTNQTVSNSTGKASFSVNGSSQTRVGGGLLTQYSTGSSGILLCAAALSSNRSVSTGDTIEVTYTFSAADSTS